MSYATPKIDGETFTDFEPWRTELQGNAQTGPQANPRLLFLLVGLFLIVGPLALAPSNYVVPMKYARMGLLALAGIVAIRWYPRGGRLGHAFLVLGAVYAISSLWSDAPITALTYKSMFFFMILGGLCLGNVIYSMREFVALSRVVVSTGVLFGLTLIVLIQQGAVEPPRWFHGRFTILGMNANFVGLFAAVYFVFGVVLIFFEHRANVRALGLVVVLAFGWIVLYSSSRLSILMCLAATGLLFLTKTEKYRREVIWGGVAIAIALMVFFVFSPGGQDATATEFYVAEGETGSGIRAFDELTKDTRTSVWAGAIRQWQTAPILGVGWANFRGRWSLFHSAFLQIIVEAGLLGAGAWCYALWSCFKRSRFIYVNRGLLSFNEYRIVELGLCIIFCCLLYGAGESGLIAATMPLAIALGLGLQYVDEATAIIQYRKSLTWE